MPLEPGHMLNNRFRVAAKIEIQEFGALYRAWDLERECLCIIKEISEEIPGGTDRFENPAQVLIKLDHPHLQKVIDYSLIPGKGFYLVLQYLEGINLDKFQKENSGVIEEKAVLKWMSQVCGALELLHNQYPPLIHGSIYPQNIVVNRQGNALLADLSCALFLHEYDQKALASACCKEGYSAPEWRAEEKIDVRSDIYSLGATLYSLLTGITPLASEKRIIEDTIQAADKANPSISFGVARAIEHAMSLDPVKRFLNVKAFQNALLSGAGLPDKAIAPGASQTLPGADQKGSLKSNGAASGKPKRKWLGWAIAGGIVGLLVIGCLALSAFGFWKGFPEILGLNPTETAVKKVEKTRKVEKEEDRQTEDAAEETEEMPATEEPVVVITEEPATQVQLEIWHSFTDTGADAFAEIIAAFTKGHPYVSIEQTYVKATDMYSMFDTAMAAGDGPALIMLIGDDRSASLLEEGFIRDVSGLISPSLYSNMTEPAVEIAEYQDGMLGVPFIINGVLLYRNASIIPEAPVNWDDLIGKASASTTGDITGMVFETGVYFSAGHLYALGGQLLDEYSGEPLFLDDHGVEWMVLMQNVKNAGLPVVNYSEDDADGFRDGKTGMVIDGNWNAQSMAEAVGVPNLVIDEWPQGMSGFVQAELISLVNDPDMDKNEEVASIAFMEFLASEQAQMIWADVACGNHDLGNGVPVLKDIYIADPLVEMAMRAYSGGVPFPTQPNLVLYWPTVNTAINNVVKYSMDPWDALQSAHDEIRSQLP